MLSLKATPRVTRRLVPTQADILYIRAAALLRPVALGATVGAHRPVLVTWHLTGFDGGLEGFQGLLDFLESLW
jgi:hypothetical protein